MAVADFHTRSRGGNQGTGNAQVFFAAEQSLGIQGAKGQSQNGGDGSQGDIALFPGQTESQGFDTVVLFLAQNAIVGNGARIGAGIGAGQGETGNFLATGQAGQVVLFLFFGAIVQQQPIGRA